MTKNNKIHIISSMFVVMIVISLIVSSAHVGEEIPLWKVQVGDTMSYTFIKYYDHNDLDKNGDLNSRELPNVTIRKDTTMKVKIIDFPDDSQVSVASTLNDGENETNFTFSFRSWRGGSGMFANEFAGVSKTIINRTYWEAYAQEWSWVRNNSYQQPPYVEPINTSIREISLEGDLLVDLRKVKDSPLYITQEVLTKHNWKTGWLTYFSLRTYNLTDIREWTMDTLFSEWTYSTGTKGLIPSFNGIPVILGIFFAIFARTITGRFFTRKSRGK